MAFHVMGTGSARPEHVVTNDDLSRFLDTDDEWISSRTGISSRRCCTTETCSDLAEAAARAALDNAGVAMHCDIVVGAMPGQLAYLIGGNVQQAVTLRQLKLDANGYFSGLPMRGANDAECTPDALFACDANRQNWAVMLKLKPADELARLAPPPMPTPAQPQAPERCVTMADGIRVCSVSDPEPPSAAPTDTIP